jgi:hypothetical protein
MQKPCVNIESTMYWWLSKGRPFIINNEYKLELITIDYKHGTAKINITNLKTQEVLETSMEDFLQKDA